LDLSGTLLTDFGGRALVSELKGPYLVDLEIWLNGTAVADETGVALGQSVACCHKLAKISLVLENSKIGNHGVGSIAAGLATLGSLNQVTFKLDGSQVSGEGLHAAHSLLRRPGRSLEIEPKPPISDGLGGIAPLPFAPLQRGPDLLQGVRGQATNEPAVVQQIGAPIAAQHNQAEALRRLEVGMGMLYQSASYGGWIHCKITQVFLQTGQVMIDVKPGVWLSPGSEVLRFAGGERWQASSEPPAVLQTGAPIAARLHQAEALPRLEVGMGMLYQSASYGGWIHCKITQVFLQTGQVMIDVKPGVWLSPGSEVLRFAGGGDGQARHIAGDVGRAGTPIAHLMPVLEVGKAMLYNSLSRGGWIPCKITQVCLQSRQVMIDIKPGVWLVPNPEVLRAAADS